MCRGRGYRTEEEARFLNAKKKKKKNNLGFDHAA
jgi:hypothetical protein